MSETEPALSGVVRAPCSDGSPHDAHFYQSFIAGWLPGPVPSLTCLCPGASDTEALARCWDGLGGPWW